MSETLPCPIPHSGQRSLDDHLPVRMNPIGQYGLIPARRVDESASNGLPRRAQNGEEGIERNIQTPPHCPPSDFRYSHSCGVGSRLKPVEPGCASWNLTRCSVPGGAFGCVLGMNCPLPRVSPAQVPPCLPDGEPEIPRENARVRDVIPDAELERGSRRLGETRGRGQRSEPKRLPALGMSWGRRSQVRVEGSSPVGFDGNRSRGMGRPRWAWTASSARK